MDTPALAPPDTSQEKKVLDKLSEIRNQLVLLKTDRTTYLRSQEVIPLYDETIEQVNQLDESLGFAEGKPTTQRMRCFYHPGQPNPACVFSFFPFARLTNRMRVLANSRPCHRQLLPNPLPLLPNHWPEQRSSRRLRPYEHYPTTPRSPRRMRPLFPPRPGGYRCHP